MLPTDWILSQDEKFLPWVQTYADDKVSRRFSPSFRFDLMLTCDLDLTGPLLRGLRRRLCEVN